MSLVKVCEGKHVRLVINSRTTVVYSIILPNNPFGPITMPENDGSPQSNVFVRHYDSQNRKSSRRAKKHDFKSPKSKKEYTKSGNNINKPPELE